MAEVAWSEPALLQLEAIIAFIALDKPEAARAVVSRVIETTDHLERFLRLGRPIKEFPRKGYRQVWIKPCWLCYRIDGGDVYILHVRRAEKPLRIDDLIADDNDCAEPIHESDALGADQTNVRRIFTMGLAKLKTEGGQGGGRGHSSMNHWFPTEEIKNAARIRRRIESKATIAHELDESVRQPNQSKDPTPSSGASRASHEPRHC